MKPLPNIPTTSSYQRERLKELQAELNERRIEALRLYTPSALQEEIHSCTASEVLVIGGNRSGKTMCSAIEAARAATGRDPHKKYPERDGVLAIVGRNWQHIGMVCVPYLLRAGAFKIIRDPATKQFRAYDPVKDAARSAEAKPAPPLIPPRMIKNISWVLKSANYCNNIELTNGWRIFFFSSEGEPPQGFQADLVWCDEDIVNDQWVPEMQARLADRKGKFRWSAMPHSKSESLLSLSERAERVEEAGIPNPNIKKFTLRFLDNVHIDASEKAKAIERWAAAGEDVLRMRSEGAFVTDSILVYPSFNMLTHGMNKDDLPGGMIPADWTRYAAVDPGHQVCAALFLAVPPDGKSVVVYDEMYIRQCSAVTFGEKFKEATRGQDFYSFIIDMHGGRLRDIGSGRQVVVQYVEELRKHGVRSQTTGSAFMAGCDDVSARTSAVRSALHIRPDGTTRLRVIRGSCPNLERELKRYRKKSVLVNGVTIVGDEPNTKGECHAVQCMEYLIASEPKFVAPRKKDEAEGMPQWMIEFMERRRQRQKPASFTYLGPQSDLTAAEMEGNANEFAEWV
jgi:hypothetical protein